MKKDLLQTVKEDLRKRGDKDYDVLYTLFSLVPSVVEKLIRFEEKTDKLYINNDEIGYMKDITEVHQTDNQDAFRWAVEFEKLDINTGIVYETRKLKFDLLKDLSYTLEDWIENPTYNEEVNKIYAENQFGEWLDFMDLAIESIVVNDQLMTVGDFRKEVYGENGHLKTFQMLDDNKWKVKNHLDKEYILSDGITVDV